MRQYIDLLKDILENGHRHEDRTGVGRISVFGREMRFNLQEGFPLPGAAAVFYKGMIKETLWFIRGSNDANELSNDGVKIWDKWKMTPEYYQDYFRKHLSLKDDEIGRQVLNQVTSGLKFMDGKIGPMYGFVWRHAPRGMVSGHEPLPAFSELPSDKLKIFQKEWDNREALEILKKMPGITFEEYAVRRYIATVDQLQQLIVNLKTRPYSARHCITAWIPEFIPQENVPPRENIIYNRGALAPCHVFFQCFVSPENPLTGKKRLSMKMTQRSADGPVGVPYNVSQYALILTMLAQVTDMEPYELIWSGGDCHIYFDQEAKVREHIQRPIPELPKLWLNPEIKDIYDFKFDDIKILNYNPGKSMGYPVAE